MTLTEEQRGTVAFDLEAARAGIAHYRIENPSNVDTESALKELVDQANLAEDALAEIERLQASLIDLHAEYINTLEKNPGCSAWDLDEQSDADQRRLRKNAAHAISIVEPPIYLQADQQATKILELEAISRRRNEIINKQVAKIKELEEALVEMVATNPCNIPTLCDVVHDELMCPALDGNCDFWKGCPQKNELREAARKQLQAEGKIGNGDHVVGPNQMVPCWQITEERKAALWHAIKVLKENDIMEEPEEHLWDEEVTVLQAMLKEAE